MSSSCLNCSYELEERFVFCPNCSQKTHLHRLSMHDILHDGIHYFTHADKGLFGLLKNLLLKNGRVAREFTEGKRKSYFAPLNFYLVVATIFVLIMTGLSGRTSFDVVKEHPELNRIPDLVQRKHVQEIYERRHKASVFMNKYANIVAMIAVPLICFWYWLFYIKGRYNYTEHLIACMYMIGITNLAYVLVFTPVSRLMGIKGGNASFIVVIIFFIFQIIYSSVFYYNFINEGSAKSAWKATGASAFVMVFWFILSSSLMGLYISNGFWGLL